MNYLLDFPNPHGQHFYTTRRTCQHGINGPHLIVLHSAENLPDFDGVDDGAEAVARYASNTDRAVSWHTTIDSDSTVSMLPYSYTAFHVRGFNRCSVGIEIATRHDAWLDAPEAWLHGVYDNVADELAKMKDELGIPLIDRRQDASKWGVTTHAVLDPSRRKDPGLAFPFAWVLQMASIGYRYSDPPPVVTVPLPPDRPLEPVSLLGDPTVSILDMQDWARSHGATRLFVELAAYAYSESVKLGVDPAVVYAIMAHETGFGRFGGVLDASFNNYGGIKTADGGDNQNPNAHAYFNTPHLGVSAVVQHVAGYAGLKLHSHQIVDPRFSLLENKRIEALPSDDWTWATSEHDSNVVRYVHEMSDF